jgi:hypothetical protein
MTAWRVRGWLLDFVSYRPFCQTSAKRGAKDWQKGKRGFAKGRLNEGEVAGDWQQGGATPWRGNVEGTRAASAGDDGDLGDNGDGPETDQRAKQPGKDNGKKSSILSLALPLGHHPVSSVPFVPSVPDACLRLAALPPAPAFGFPPGVRSAFRPRGAPAPPTGR